MMTSEKEKVFNVQLRVDSDFMTAIDDMRANIRPLPTRQELIRSLVMGAYRARAGKAAESEEQPNGSHIRYADGGPPETAEQAAADAKESAGAGLSPEPPPEIERAQKPRRGRRS